MDERESGSRLSEHEVLFLDFMGFSDAVERWADEQLGEVIDTLENLASVQSAFDVRGELLSDGSYKITGHAEVTTFADNIVVSYPFLIQDQSIPAEAWQIIQGGWADMVRKQMQRITAAVAKVGLDTGLLLRGGLSCGKLYHHGRVVLGEAMLDAYRIERHIAKMSRVAVSPRIVGDERLFIDTDGVRCLDHMTDLMMLADERHGSALAWAEDRLSYSLATAASLDRRGLTKQAAKWNDFAGRLRDVADRWD